MAVAGDVHACGALAQVGVGHGQGGQRGLGPRLPGLGGQLLAAVGQIAQCLVVGEHGGAGEGGARVQALVAGGTSLLLTTQHLEEADMLASNIMVIDKAEMDAGKTKDLVAAFKSLGIENALIISGAEVNENFARAARNIPNIDVLPVAGLNVYDILRRRTLVITKEAAEGIKARFDGVQEEAEA